MKVISLKPPATTLNLRGYGKITNADLNEELYNEIVAIDEGLADLFVVEDIPTEKLLEKKSKSTKQISE